MKYPKNRGTPTAKLRKKARGRAGTFKKIERGGLNSYGFPSIKFKKFDLSQSNGNWSRARASVGSCCVVGVRLQKHLAKPVAFGMPLKYRRPPRVSIIAAPSHPLSSSPSLRSSNVCVSMILLLSLPDSHARFLDSTIIVFYSSNHDLPTRTSHIIR